MVVFRECPDACIGDRRKTRFYLVAGARREARKVKACVLTLYFICCRVAVEATDLALNLKRGGFRV